MYLVINKCVTAVKASNFSGHYLRNGSTLDIGVLGYIGIVQHKEHSPEVLSIPPGTPCTCSMLHTILHIQYLYNINLSYYAILYFVFCNLRYSCLITFFLFSYRIYLHIVSVFISAANENCSTVHTNNKRECIRQEQTRILRNTKVVTGVKKLKKITKTEEAILKCT